MFAIVGVRDIFIDVIGFSSVKFGDEIPTFEDGKLVSIFFY